MEIAKSTVWKSEGDIENVLMEKFVNNINRTQYSQKLWSGCPNIDLCLILSSEKSNFKMHRHRRPQTAREPGTVPDSKKDWIYFSQFWKFSRIFKLVLFQDGNELNAKACLLKKYIQTYNYAWSQTENWLHGLISFIFFSKLFTCLEGWNKNFDLNFKNGLSC